MITVTYSKPGALNQTSEFGDIDAAVRHAAKLARVTERTIRKRLKKSDQVGGREIGEDGVWIEQ